MLATMLGSFRLSNAIRKTAFQKQKFLYTPTTHYIIYPLISPATLPSHHCDKSCRKISLWSGTTLEGSHIYSQLKSVKPLEYS